MCLLDLARSLSIEVVDLDHTKLTASSEAIKSRDLDILLYLALPTEKFSLFLSYMRLAPIQIQFGKLLNLLKLASLALYRSERVVL
jgi:hypothetical protein